MEEKLQKIEKLSNYALVGMLIFFILSFWWEGLNIFSSICTCILYLCMFFKIRISSQNDNRLLFLSCMVSIIWLFVNFFFPFAFSPVISNFFIYLYLNLTAKVSNGGWNKYLIFVGVFGVVGNLLFILTEVVWFLVIALILQMISLVKYIDPLLERMALERRAQRLGLDYETVKAEYRSK